MITWFPIHLHYAPSSLAELDWDGAVVCIERDAALLSRYWGWTGAWPSEPWAQLAAFLERWPVLAKGSPLATARRVAFAIEDEGDLGPLERLEELARLGLAVVQLHHHGCTRYFHPLRGLTTEGRELVAELGRLNLYVDLSHLHESALRDVLGSIAGPKLLSHVVADSLLAWSPTIRSNALDDDELRCADAELYGVPFIDDLVAPFGVRRQSDRNANTMDIARQIAHLIHVVGQDRVALGPDYFAYCELGVEGVEVGPVSGMDMPSGLVELWSQLELLGLDSTGIRAVFSENAKRVFCNFGSRR